MPLLVNVQMTVAAVAGGVLTLGAATPGARTFAAAGAANGVAYSYRIEEGARWEIGSGTYSASDLKFTRVTVFASSAGNLPETFTAAAVISQVALPCDLGAGGRQRIINGNLAINQRGSPAEATSYAAGSFVFDRWKAGPSGATVAWAAGAGGDVAATISSGSLVQVIEGKRYLPEGGDYVLSWQGSCGGRVYQGAAAGGLTYYPIGGLRVPALAAGVNTTIEFGTGTLGLVQFEPGLMATEFERRDDELRRCRRYYEKSYPAAVRPGAITRSGVAGLFLNGISGLGGIYTRFNEPKAVIPQVGVWSPSDGSSGVLYDVVNQVNRTATLSLVSDEGFRAHSLEAGNGGQCVIEFHFTASAEI